MNSRRTLATVLTLYCVAALAACTPGAHDRLPRGDWEVAAGGAVHGTELRYLTLVGATYGEPAEPASERLLRFLGEVGPTWRMPERIDTYAFPDRETLRALTGWDTNGRAILAHDATVSVHAADAHEVMHLLATPIERPLRLASFWMEGVAMTYTWPEVYFDAATLAERGLPPRLGAWYGKTVHGNAREARERGELPALTPLAHGNQAFNALPDGITYPAAGSFVTFLLGPGTGDPARIAAFQAFFEEANRAQDAAAVLASFERNLGTPLSEAEATWHAFLDAWDEAAAE
ncbi:MAG: hypothetical protein K0A98_09155 [Trueperaceae bacterium]|nr:hypothetical protein [Trueperaceae bacterium]